MANQWFFSPDGRNRLGPYTLEQMRQLADSGRLKPTHMVRLRVLDAHQQVVSSDVSHRLKPDLTFRAGEADEYLLELANPSEQDAVVGTILFKK